MAIQPQPQKLQSQPSATGKIRGIALGFGPWIARQACGQAHLIHPEGQGLLQMAGHKGRKRSGIAGREAHVFIEVETQPLLAQALLFPRRQGVHRLDQGPIDRLHGAARGQAQGLVGPALTVAQQAGRHVLCHRRPIGAGNEFPALGMGVQGGVKGRCRGADRCPGSSSAGSRDRPRPAGPGHRPPIGSCPRHGRTPCPRPAGWAGAAGWAPG